jgi:dihydroorotase
MKNEADLLIKGAKVVIVDNSQKATAPHVHRRLKVEMLDLAITGKKIVAIGSETRSFDAEQEINARGLHILPGLIDTQVHFREPGFPLKEDLASGTRAAILGGITTVFEMPNTAPPTLSAIDLNDKLARAKGRAWCNYGFYMGADLSNFERLPHLETLPGCVGVKIFLGSSTGHLVLEKQEALETVMRSCRKRISFHAEDETRLTERRHIAENSGGNPAAHPEWRDSQTAFIATKRIVELAQKYQRKIHILHVTSKEEMEYLKDFKGLVSVETTPQHLTLSAPECYEKLGTLVQMNPPIRSEEHTKALWQGIENGTVDVLGSDHAPHTLDEKKQTYPKSPSGMTGVQTMLPLMLNHLSEGRISLERIVQLLADQPHRNWGIRHKGVLEPGFDADLTFVDLKKTRTIENKWIASKCGWTPFDGMKITGWPVATILNGQVVMRDDQLIGKPSGLPLEF